MSAADLFKDHNDVYFRLYKTHIVIGKLVARVRDASPGYSPSAENTYLFLELQSEGDTRAVKLGNLPLSSMVYCPVGYIGESWLSRGPDRNRYQGITGETLWHKTPDGVLGPHFGLGSQELRQILTALLAQPKRKTRRMRKGSPITNKILVTKDDLVLNCGEIVGEYAGKNKVALLGTPSPVLLHNLELAALSPIE